MVVVRCSAGVRGAVRAAIAVSLASGNNETIAVTVTHVVEMSSVAEMSSVVCHVMWQTSPHRVGTRRGQKTWRLAWHPRHQHLLQVLEGLDLVALAMTICMFTFCCGAAAQVLSTCAVLTVRCVAADAQSYPNCTPDDRWQAGGCGMG